VVAAAMVVMVMAAGEVCGAGSTKRWWCHGGAGRDFPCWAQRTHQPTIASSFVPLLLLRCQA
jgi:hypothetical protein